MGHTRVIHVLLCVLSKRKCGFFLVHSVNVYAADDYMYIIRFVIEITFMLHEGIAVWLCRREVTY